MSSGKNEAVKFIKRKINSKKYGFGAKLNSINSISQESGVSRYKVKTALNRLVDDGYLVRTESYGFWVVGHRNNMKTPEDKTKLNIFQIKNNLRAAELLNNGGILYRRKQLIISSSREAVNIFNIITGIEDTYKINELIRIKKEFITASNAVTSQKTLMAYKRQFKLMDVYAIVSRYKKELDIQL